MCDEMKQCIVAKNCWTKFSHAQAFTGNQQANTKKHKVDSMEISSFIGTKFHNAIAMGLGGAWCMAKFSVLLVGGQLIRFGAKDTLSGIPVSQAILRAHCKLCNSYEFLKPEEWHACTTARERRQGQV
jgi:hypothetical protein